MTTYVIAYAMQTYFISTLLLTWQGNENEEKEC